MGRAARNHGGTGGHGYVPLPGERPNYNQHVMTDKALLSLVSINVMKKLQKPREKETHMGQQKGYDAKLSKNDLLNHPLSSAKPSAKQPMTWTKQALTSANLPVSAEQQPVTSAKHPLTSAQQPVTSTKERVTSAKQSLTTANQPVISTDKPVTLADLQETSVKQPVTSLMQKVTLEQTLKSEKIQVPIFKMPPVQLSSSKEEQLSSTNNDYQCSNLFVKTPLMNRVSPLPFKSATGQVQQPQQLMKQFQQQEEHQPELTSIKKFCTSAQQTMTADKLPLVFVQESVTPGRQSSGQQPNPSFEQPWSSKQEASVQQLLTSVHQTGTPVKGQQPLSSYEQQITSVNHPAQQFLPSLLHPVPWAQVMQSVNSLQSPIGNYVMNFVQPEYEGSNCSPPRLLVPVYQLYNFYCATSSWFPDTFQETGSVSPRMQMGVKSHLESAHYPYEVSSTGSQA